MIMYGACVGMGRCESGVAEDAMRSFADVCSEPPLEVRCDVEIVSAEDACGEIAQALQGPCWLAVHGALVRWLRSTGGTAHMSAAGDPVSDTAIIVCCSPGHPVTARCVEEAPHAVWGATEWLVALVYSSLNRFIIWHEMLHLLRAEDCYDPDDRDEVTCGFEGCIMQYAPTSCTVRQRPFLCDGNVQRIRKAMGVSGQD